MTAQGEACDGLIFLGYPLHPAKQVDKLRVEHWAKLSSPALFVQGTRDALCGLDVLKAELPRIPASVTLHTVDGGDHSFKVAKSIAKSQEDVWQEMVASVTQWITKTQHSQA